MQRVQIDGVVSAIDGHLTKEDLMTSYGDVFRGVGMFEREYHIEVDPSVQPVIQAPRKMPYAKHTQLKETIDRLERDGIIASVDKPTDRVHNLVITEKRIGARSSTFEAGDQLERYQIPTASDVQSQLYGKQIFTVIDMKDGFWQVRLSEESSY